jgi:site-specific DNA-methyltransferase (adenine-specific)
VTETSDFGASRRESHDASSFYRRFTAPEMSDDEEVCACTVSDSIILGDARDMAQVPAKSVALVCSSPPYFSGKRYEEEMGRGHVPSTYVEYLRQLEDVFAECRRVLEPGGRIAINVANLGRKPYRSLSGDVTRILQDNLGFLLRGEIIWQKAVGASGNCAWGSFMKPSNPVLRDVTERVIVASKGRFDRALDSKRRAALGLPHEASITKEDFMSWTLDVWHIAPESATRVGHPAPYPVDLPRRLVELYTYRGDVVLDPFIGSGTTAVAAIATRRHYVGYETDKNYVRLAERRIQEAREAREEDAA